MNNAKDKLAAVQRIMDQMRARIIADIRRDEERGDGDEAVLKKIRLSVLDVFRRLFQMSSARELGVKQPLTGLRAIAELRQTDSERVYRTFRYYLNMVTRAWPENRDRAQRHDDAMMVVKETVKLEMAEWVRTEFEAVYAGEKASCAGDAAQLVSGGEERR